MPTLPEILLIVFAAFTIGTAVGVAATRRVVSAAFLLFASLFGVAGLFVFAGSGFLAVTQVIVYVGGVLVLLLFGVMLSHRLTLGTQGEPLPATKLTQLPLALLAAASIAAVLLVVFVPWIQAQPSGRTPASTVPLFGVRLLTDWLVAFELLSVLLLAALVGAAYLSRRAPARPRDVSEQGAVNRQQSTRNKQDIEEAELFLP